MRKLLLICTLFISLGLSAQTTPDTDSIRTFIDTYIRNSSITPFTNLRLNTSLKWLANRIDTVAASSGGGSTDTTSLSNRINAKQDSDADLTTYASITPTTVAQSLLAFANPSAIRFFRVNADNTVSGRTAAEMLSDIGGAASSHTHAVSTDITGLGTGVSSFLGTPSSANLAAAITNETGSGSLVFGTSPTLVTPNLGIPSAVTLTNATGLPISTGVSGLGTGVSAFLATPSSANLATAVTDETGTGSLVFGTSPDFTGSITISGVDVPTISSSNTLTGKSMSGADNSFSNIPQAAVTSLTSDLAAKQPLDADLTTIAGLTATTDNFIVSSASAWASRTPAQVKTTLSLNNVDNTSDANKPVSTATQTALDGKQPLNAYLTDIAGLTLADGDLFKFNGTDIVNITTNDLKTALDITKADIGLSDVQNYSLVGIHTATEELKNKTINGDSNTISNIAVSSIKASETEDITVAGLVLDTMATAPSATAGAATVFARYFAGRPWLGQVGSLDASTYIYQPTVWSGFRGWARAQGNDGSTVNESGLDVLGTTPTAATWATTNLFTSRRRATIATASSAGSSAGMRNVAANFFLGDGPGEGGFFMTVQMGFSAGASVANRRAFVGMQAAGAALIGNVEPTSLTNSIGFAFNAGGTAWTVISNDGSGTATTHETLTSDFPTNTNSTDWYQLSLFVPSGQNSVAYWHIKRTANSGTTYEDSGTISTDLPVANQILNYNVWINNGSTALVDSFDFSTIYIECDN